MKEINVSLGERSCKILAGARLDDLGVSVKKHVLYKGLPPGKALIITNPALKALARIAAKSLLRARIVSSEVLIPAGERSKNLRSVEKLYHVCVRENMDRSSCIVALGGGVIGDMAGFAAATYLRGISLVQVPTTLLAMVDSGIGGKTGVDLPEAKNFVGAFYQPKLVLTDPRTLETLPEREFISGMAEVIKYGVISDAKLFRTLENFSPYSAGSAKLPEIIFRCAKIKADVVSKDERETKGLREALNFGHTIGHAVETLTEYKTYKHGEAVALGMCAAGHISRMLGIWNAEDSIRMENLISAAGLPVRLRKPLSAEKALRVIFRDKKTQSGELRFVLPVRIGKVIVRKITAKIALKGFEYIRS